MERGHFEFFRTLLDLRGHVAFAGDRLPIPGEIHLRGSLLAGGNGPAGQCALSKIEVVI